MKEVEFTVIPEMGGTYCVNFPEVSYGGVKEEHLDLVVDMYLKAYGPCSLMQNVSTHR